MSLHDAETVQVVLSKQPRATTMGFRRLTRAHLAFDEHPGFLVEAQGLMNAVSRALGEHLGCRVSIVASLLPVALNPAKALGMGTAFVLVDLSALGAHALLEVEFDLMAALLAKVAGGGASLAAATRLTRIEEAALGYLALRTLAAVREHTSMEPHFAPRLAAIGLDRDEMLARLDRTSPYLGIKVELELDGIKGYARLLMPAHPLQLVIQQFPQREPDPLAPEVAEASVGVRVLAGRITLDAREVAGLGPGDVVLCDGLRIQDGRLLGPTRLLGARFSCRGETTDQGLHIEQVASLAYPMEMTVLHSPDSAAELPVDVEVQLASVKLTLLELSRLKPGNIVPLHINVAEPVVLKVGDRSVARAELVDVEGEVGARILSLLP